MKSLLKDSEPLRNALAERWKELKLTQLQVAQDAEKNGRKDIFRSAVNKYLNNHKAYGSLNEDQILWLAKRYCIQVGVYIKVNPYNEQKALKSIK